jgi:hypothetical protein
MSSRSIRHRVNSRSIHACSIFLPTGMHRNSHHTSISRIQKRKQQRHPIHRSSGQDEHLFPLNHIARKCVAYQPAVYDSKRVCSQTIDLPESSSVHGADNLSDKHCMFHRPAQTGSDTLACQTNDDECTRSPRCIGSSSAERR